MDAVGVRYSSSVPSIILMAWPPMQTVWMRVAVLLARNGGRKLEKGNLKMGKRKGRNSKIEVEKRAIGKSKFARDPTGRQSA
jgi:hypothetical protein